MTAPLHALGDAGAPRFERYEVLRRLGTGGMAEVYEVEHRELGRRFALKVLRSDRVESARVVERFRQEARTLSCLDSPHIVDVVDAGTSESGLPYFVMELLGGTDLRRLLGREGTLPVRRAVHIGIDLCKALEVAHAAGVVHRDLKPENVVVTEDAEGRDVCKLLDFGVAKSLALAITRDDALIGTARYMAPEQFAGEGGVGPASDLFALGVILFECLSGRTPFDGDRMERILFSIMHEPVAPLAELRPELPTELVALVHSLLEKRSADRPASAAAVGRALEALVAPAQSSTSPREDTLCEQPVVVVPREPPARHRWRVAALLAALGCGVLIGLVAASRPRVVAGPAVASSVAAPAPSQSQPAAPKSEPAAAPAAPPSPPPPVKHPKAAAPRLVPLPGTPAEERPALFFPSDPK
jgi:serine/threonine-protein kinase